MMPLLGCIADEFTGGTDLAGMLVKYGMRAGIIAYRLVMPPRHLGVPSLGKPPTTGDRLTRTVKIEILDRE
jgi:hypothetical protein